MQVAVLGGSANGERQADEIARLAARLRAAGVAEAPPVGVLPDEFRRASLEAPCRPSGWCSPSVTSICGPRGIPLDQGHVLVAGPPRSGKTTALATIAQSAALAGIPLFHVHVRPTPLSHAPFWGKVAQGAADGAQLLEKIAGVAERFGRRTLVVVDDLGELCDTEADTALTELLRLARDHPITVIAAVDNTVARRQYSGADPGDPQGRHRRPAAARHRQRRRPRRRHAAPAGPGRLGRGPRLLRGPRGRPS